jgi:DNA-binding response OmpR family regulator
MDQKKQILVVDDEPDIVNIVSMMLEKEGFCVSSASNGIEALSSVKESKPDVIFLDRNMPEMGGDEVMTRLKESPETSSIPIILLTSLDKYEDVSGGYGMGADGYVTKPFTHSQISNGLRLVLTLRPNLSDDALKAHAVEFLQACYQLSNRAKELAENCAAQEGLPTSQWLYQGLEIRLKKEQNHFGNLKKAPDWMYVFRGWGVDFYNSKTGEQLSLAIGPDGRSDSFDEWRIQNYIETETQWHGLFAELNSLIKNHSDASEKFIEYLSSQEWIERAKGEGNNSLDGAMEAQLEDRWVVTSAGVQVLP